MFSSIKRLLFGNLRKQLTVGIVMVVTTMILLFVWDMTRRQQTVEMNQHSEQVSALASSAATSAAVWVFSRDFSGLQEIILGIARYPGVRRAIVLDLKGQVLAHSDPTKIGLYLTDLPQKPGAPVLQRTVSFIDVISPVMLANRQIGWVRIGLDPAHFNADVDQLWQSGLFYALIGAALSVLVAALTGRYLTRRLDAIQQVASAVQAGASELRVVLPGDDEAAQLARQFNGMIDSLVQREETVKKSEERFRSLTEMSSDFYWETDAQHRLTQRTESQREARESVFHEASSIGKRRWEVSYLSPDESGWQKHRAMLDAHLPFRNFEISRLRTNDAEHWISVSGDPVFSISGEFMGYRGVGADITERKKTEEVQTFLAKTSSGPADQPFFEALARFLAQSLGMFYVCIDHLEGDGLNARTLAIWCDGRFEDNVTYALKDTPCGDVVGQAVCCFPASVCQLFPRDQVLQELNAESYIGVTLWSHTGRPIGLIAVIGRAPLENHSLAETVLKLVAARAAGELERLDSEKTLRESEERWKFAIEGSGDGLWDWNIQTGHAFYSPRYKTMLGYAEDEIGNTAAEWTDRIHPDDATGVMVAMQPYLDGKPGSATVEFRMLCKDGSWLWTMGRGMVVERDAQGKPLRMIGINTDITERKEHESQLEHIAHFDALTNLPNRVLLGDRLQQAMAQAQRRGQQLAVVYLDLDGFKAINDKHGHEVGDQVLITLAQRMKQALREGDSLARLGGDEFVIVLIDLDDLAASRPMLIRLLEACAQPVDVEDLSLLVSASLGVTAYPQSQEIDADQLLRQADQAMYQAKLAGKNRYHIFDAALDSSIRGHHESVERIRLALEMHEFVLYFQPKVNMRSGQVIGVEALIRWQHSGKGLLAPALFLPVIEDHALAVSIGEWVIDTALTQIELWRAAGLDMKVSVNIGARQLQQSDFVDRLKSILAKHPHVDPASLELEVLETSALKDIAQVSQVIEDCAQIGVIFALDDFGTGYSSLTYLKRLRVAMLKIDQSFVRDMLEDPDDLAILQGIIGLAAAFKRQVIAEGVETVAHGSLLLQLGCELAQGYGIARPMPPDQLPAWAARWQPDAAWGALPWLGGLETES
ncbi:MAG: EAL domain-containing protein [Burkholderiales bacterium]|nr:EAL domain-containing protein [Burkholderiales bacterium]